VTKLCSEKTKQNSKTKQIRTFFAFFIKKRGINKKLPHIKFFACGGLKNENTVYLTMFFFCFGVPAGFVKLFRKIIKVLKNWSGTMPNIMPFF
jgi:hypothetical protein